MAGRGLTIDFNANVVRFTNAIDKATNDLAKFQTNASRTASNIDKSFARLGSGLQGIFGGLAAAVSIRELGQMADSFTNMQARLKLATRDSNEFAEANANIRRIAESSKGPLEATTVLYTRIAQALLEVGGTQKQIADTTQALALGLRISGASAEESASAMQQFSQAIGSGILAGEEFKALNESAPRIMRAVADSIGVPIGQLRAMSKEGKLTRDILVEGLGSQLPKLIKEAETLPNTIGTAFQEAKNELLLTIGLVDKFTGASKKAADAVGLIGKAFRGWRDALGDGGQDSVISDRLRETEKLMDSALKMRSLFDALGMEPPKGASDSYINKLNQQALELKKSLEGVRQEAGKVAEQPADSTAGMKALLAKADAEAKAAEAAKAAAQASKALANQQKTFIEGLQKEADTLGMTASQMKVYEAGLLKISGARLEGVKASAERIDAFKREQDALKDQIAFESRQAEEFYANRDRLAKETQQSLEALNREGQNLKLSVDPMARMNAEVERYSALLKQGAIDQKTFDLAVAQSTANMKRATEDGFEQMSAAAIGFQTNIQRGLGDNIYKALNGDFENIGSAWKSLLSRMLADALAANLSSSIFGKNGITGMLSMFGSILGSLGGMAGGGGAAGATKITGGGLTGFAAKGAYFNGNVAKFALGGVVNSPTPFRFADGGSFRNGLMGEAGPEAIMPLKRDSAGRLGVSGGGGGVVINDSRVINIDSRSDRASIMQDIQRATKQSNAELIEKLERQGRV